MELRDLKSFGVLKEKDPILAGQVESVYNLTMETINGISRFYDNYTMHDMNHGLRVASYMEDLAFGIDENKDSKADKFNGLELALMILSAILHDIGMFIRPEDQRDIQNNNIKYNSNSLTFDGVLKVISDKNEAVKEIIRQTHAARINEFINYKFDDQTISNILKVKGKYSYADDVAQICKAHGEDYSYVALLRKEATKGDYTYNLQYLAVLLRIADLLDLDRQRTPILWYSMMEIKGFSRDEWEKHFIIQNEKKFKQHFDGKIQIYFDGKSADAKVHRKYLRFIDQLKDELERADNLLNYKNANEKYKLFVSPKVDDRVQTEGFKYADLRLNLDYSSITELLMGKNIYGDSRLGLRELIQNSIDACNLMREVNNENFDYPDPAITISFSINKNYLKVKDTGIGMTLDVVKRHFLNVGKSYYKSNEYKFENHAYQPIGQYGIGFLACFLLSDNVSVKTKYYKNNEISHLELERNSEYVVTNTEETGSFFGTEITLEYNKFFEVFKNESDLTTFLEEYFYTDIPIYIKNDDLTESRIQIQNNCEQVIINGLEKESLKGKVDEIDCGETSNILSGKIKIVAPNKFKIVANNINTCCSYIFNNKENRFTLLDNETLGDGFYYIIKYADLEDYEYNKIKSTRRGSSSKKKEMIALSMERQKQVLLLISADHEISFYDLYFANGELKINNTSFKEIIERSGLKYYKELLDDYSDYSLIFLSENNYLEINRCVFEKYQRPYIFSGERGKMFFLYNKGILVEGFRGIACPYPYQAYGLGYINYLGNDLKLDVSRNNINTGSDILENEITLVILKQLLKKEKDLLVQKLIHAMINHIGEEKTNN